MYELVLHSNSPSLSLRSSNQTITLHSLYLEQQTSQIKDGLILRLARGI